MGASIAEGRIGFAFSLVLTTASATLPTDRGQIFYTGLFILSYAFLEFKGEFRACLERDMVNVYEK